MFDLSSPPNPFFESPPPGTELRATDLPPASPAPSPAENPVWTGWDVLLIAVLMFLTPILLFSLILGVAHRFLYRALPWSQLQQKPTLALVAELLAYVAVLFCMIALIEGKYHVRFFHALISVSTRWGGIGPRPAVLIYAWPDLALLFCLDCRGWHAFCRYRRVCRSTNFFSARWTLG